MVQSWGESGGSDAHPRIKEEPPLSDSVVFTMRTVETIHTCEVQRAGIPFLCKQAQTNGVVQTEEEKELWSP